MKRYLPIWLLLILLQQAGTAQILPEVANHTDRHTHLNEIDREQTIRIQIDCGEAIGDMDPVYAWFGHDEPNYTYMKDGRKLLSELAALSPVPVYVRTHNLLTSGDGRAALKWGSTNAYTEDANGNPIYNWTIVDKIFDTYVERGIKPLVEIGFMPEALSSRPEPYRHNWAPGNPYGNIFTGWAYPPKDYEKWAELVYQWVKHSYPHNGYRNGTMYSSYTAASFARKMALADHFGVNFKGAVTWAFEFEDQPWFHGFRDLATNGLDKPVLNVFRMFGMMSGKRVAVRGDLAYDFISVRDSSVRGETTDVNALATKDERSAAILVWNYHDDDRSGAAAPVELEISGLPAGRLQLQHYRVDQRHSNAYTAWKNMDSPQHPTSRQYTDLEQAGQLELLENPEWITVGEESLLLQLDLPRQGVSLLRFNW